VVNGTEIGKFKKSSNLNLKPFELGFYCSKQSINTADVL
jgi:hypothetical protein